MPTVESALDLESINFQTDGLGTHVLVDMIGCETLPDGDSQLEADMIEAARRIGATVVTTCFHQFNPHGLSGVVVIAESHLAIHTWPERQTACVDLFTCSPDMQSAEGLSYLFERFGAKSMEVNVVARGIEKGNS